jgi:glycerol-3-phosphate dehydrogenase
MSDYDVAVIGAGIVGAAIARRLAAYELKITLIEARDDVGDGTSKANTALLHTGFDASPGTLESRLVRRGYELLGSYADQVGIPVERTGAVLVAWNQEELDTLPALEEKAIKNGYERCAQLSAAEVYQRFPHLGEGAFGGLEVPDESIICTWTTNLALATEAKLRGVDIRTRSRVEAVTVADEHTVLTTCGGDVSAKVVVNAAGLGADVVDRLFGYDRFTVTPRRGELLVFDKLSRPLVNQILLAVPTKLGKGVLISPTVYGNVMLGPTAEDLDDKTATGTSESGFEFLAQKGEKLMPTLFREEVTAMYAGLRATVAGGDYIIEYEADQRYLRVGGIRSTGLTAGMAIAEYVEDLLAAAGVDLKQRGRLPEMPPMPNIGEAFTRPYQDAARIASDPEYGRMICFCERVSAGEIRDAYLSPLPPGDLGGLRRRTRAMNGRCQGFYCGAEVEALAAQHAKRREASK